MSEKPTSKRADLKELPAVSGTPAKEFFVNMLTRDIELQDAVLDLLDNCIDGILRSTEPSESEKTPYSGFFAKISFNSKLFEIQDNCGGIPWDLAKDVAFRMGAINPDRPERSIGTVGIGMKRAMFKMGRYSLVHSNTKELSFEVEIPASWFGNKEDWDFPAHRQTPQQKDFGTTIETSELYSGIASQFDGGKSSQFHQQLLSAISLHYCYIIERGFKIEVNGEKAKGKPVEILCALGKEKIAFQPFIYEGQFGPVSVFMAIGYVAQNPNEKEQTAAIEGHYSLEYSGWTIVCNDRVVVANDRTRLTGWGDAGVPSHHPQFNGIRGIVEMRSKVASDLPVTTTKRGIDAGSDLYLKIRERMQFAMKRFTGNTNRWKGHEGEQRRLLRTAEPLGLMALKAEALSSRTLKPKAISGHVNEKQFVPNLPVWDEPKTHKTITFGRAIKEIEKVSMFLFGDQRSAAEVGGTCFDRILKEAKK